MGPLWAILGRSWCASSGLASNWGAPGGACRNRKKESQTIIPHDLFFSSASLRRKRPDLSVQCAVRRARLEEQLQNRKWTNRKTNIEHKKSISKRRNDPKTIPRSPKMTFRSLPKKSQEGPKREQKAVPKHRRNEEPHQDPSRPPQQPFKTPPGQLSSTT